MPVKFQPSAKVRDRATGKVSTVHRYMKATPTKELQDYLEASNAKPKIMHKCRMELLRRGVL